MLSKSAREILIVALANARVGKEVADAIDEAGSEITTAIAPLNYDPLINTISIVQTPSYRFVTDAEKNNWNNTLSQIENYREGVEVYVDDVNGVDDPTRGSFLKPYKTISYAYSQVPNVASDLNRWCSEKLLIKVAPGTYNENVITGFKRARVALMGEGVFINGTITHKLLEADHPAAFTAAQLPAPWTNDNVRSTFELIGFGGGMEGGYTSENFMVNGQIKIESEANSNSTTWQRGGLLSHYFFAKHVQLRNGLVLAHNNSVYTTSIGPNLTIEIDSSSIEGGYIGAQPYSAGLNMPTANNLVFNIKAHNSQLKSTIGARASILEIDSCRILNIDRTMNGTVAGSQDNSGITTQNSSSYSGIVNSPFAGSIYKIGRTSTAGTITFRIDANSFGSLLEKTLDVGASTIAYNLIDKAGGSSVATAAVNYTRTATPTYPAASVEAALKGIDDALGTKASTTYADNFPSGATGSRPLSPSVGRRFYDTTIKKPIWWNGTNWTDAAGTIV